MRMKNIVNCLLSGLILSCSITAALGQQAAPPQIVINPGDMQCNGTMQGNGAWLAPVQVGTKMTCTIPIETLGEYAVVVKTFEPLMTAFVGMRVFDITVNGEKKTIDPFRVAGWNNSYEVAFKTIAHKSIQITFEATQRTAVWYQIVIQRLYVGVFFPGQVTIK
jgi:hypothetical protein